MVVALNVGRLLMLGWVLYSLVLIFFPQMVNHAPVSPDAGPGDVHRPQSTHL